MGFERLAGNQKIKDTLQQMICAGRLPHAILLEGEDGLGKSTLAGIIAAAAVCRGENKPCGICHDCHLAQIGNHPDVTLIEPDGTQIKVDTVREIIAEAQLKPSQAARKVFIFKKANAMNEAGQNALLKTLEEPPGSAVFILLVESVSSLLDTIISRCVCFSLAAPPLEEGIKILEENGIEKAEAEARLERNGGNIGRAIANKSVSLKVDPEEFINCIARDDAYSALLLLKVYDNKKYRNEVVLFFDAVITALLTARRAEALGRGYLGLSGEYIEHMLEAVGTARENCLKNGNLSLIFHTLCYTLG